MTQQQLPDFIEKVKTGIYGFDLLSEGGLPKGRTTLVAGTAGSAKTIFGCQFLVEGIREGQNGVFVTFEESPKAIRKNMRGFGWDIEQWEAEKKWAFVDASPKTGNQPLVSGEYDLGPNRTSPGTTSFYGFLRSCVLLCTQYSSSTRRFI